MRSVLALITLVAYVDSIGYVARCPRGCSCQITSSGTQLYVDCDQVLPDVDEEQLLNKLDSMLSTDHFVENLTSLSITDTPLTRVPASVCELLNLTSLNLDRNNFAELPDNCFTKLTKLVTLSAANNAIVSLRDGLFVGLQNLVTLTLSNNQIASIGLQVFSNSADLTSLRSLNLAYNRLTSLEPWWYYRCILGNETSSVNIALHDNLISNFTNKLKFDFHCGMKRPYGYVDLHHNRIAHMMDLFNGWNIGAKEGPLSPAVICLANLQGSHPLMTFNVAGSTYDCDCTDFPIYKLANVLPSTVMLSGVRCSKEKFVTPSGQSPFAHSFHLNEFMCDITDRCPSNCRCIYRPANATLHVHCSAANLSSLPHDLPVVPKSYVKYKLDFFNNKLLRRLEHRPYFINTSILDVSNCSLTEITVEVLKDVSHFRVANFRENILQSFPRQSDTVNISSRLLLGGNPWRCSCDNEWMIGWLQSLSGQIADQNDIICASPSRMYNRNVLKTTKEDLCVDIVKRYSIIIVCLAVAIATVGLGLLSYKMRVLFYKKWKFHPFDRDECVGEDMDYDVFLCCSSDDNNPHGLRILREMESKGYHVCYHLRDFLAGAPIMDNMIQSIMRSKRTLCLISENFLRR